MKIARVLIASLICALAASVSLPAAAQPFPSRPIKVIVPFGPGSGSDQLARVVADRLTEQLKVAVVVENKEGAGGIIGTQIVAKSPPDGYTIVLVSNPVTIAPHLQPIPPFDAVKDFVPIAKIGKVPLGVITSASSPFNTLPEMIAYMKANPGKASYATSGKGAQSHLEAALLMERYGVKAQDVPYKSTAQALTDTMTGEVVFYVPGLSAAMPNVKAGKLKVIMTGGSKRLAGLPDVPTAAEATGTPGYEFPAWFGFLAPAGTPPDVVNKLYEEIAKAMDSPQAKERMAALGAEIVVVPPQQFSAELRSETEKWGKLIKALDIKGE